MRFLLMISGMIMIGVGVFCIANGGLTFIALSLVIGIALILSGAALTFSYKRVNGETEENAHWILVEGLTSILLGIIVLTGYLSAELAVQAVFGIWIMISGIRSIVIYKASEEKEKRKFNWPIIIAGIELIVGVLSFFNFEIMGIPVLFLVGFCMIVQGLDNLRIALAMAYNKPETIKTKEELIADAEEAVLSAKTEVHEAIQTAKEAKEVLEEVKETPAVEEVIEKPVEFEQH